MKNQKCRRCGEFFQASVYENWEYNENGDDRFLGTEYHTVCERPKCNPKKGTAQHYQILWEDGFITEEELNKFLERRN